MIATLKTFHGETAYVSLSGQYHPKTDLPNLIDLMVALAGSDYVRIILDIAEMTIAGAGTVGLHGDGGLFQARL